ncbi:hypothetical protein CMUS01_10831 [Colletotrichum musicola]|uniref:Uncharacterized protein n=1 Tax=Colletotrichum musicola TaxID=2175873 RepID=A0A8H6K1N3_9PEZI|nr:hypothetical protein CMUS01_10831 [Colletotrichum musicola]
MTSKGAPVLNQSAVAGGNPATQACSEAAANNEMNDTGRIQPPAQTAVLQVLCTIRVPGLQLCACRCPQMRRPLTRGTYRYACDCDEPGVARRTHLARHLHRPRAVTILGSVRLGSRVQPSPPPPPSPPPWPPQSLLQFEWWL